MSSIIIPIIVGVVCAVIFGIGGFVFGGEHRRKTSEKEIGSATQEATKIINNALSEAEATKKARLVEAKDEIHKLRSEADKDIRERRSEVQRQENRLNQREEYLDKRADSQTPKQPRLFKRETKTA
jgi:ribonuclease Y